MSAPAYQFPASLPVPESQPAGQLLLISSQDKFANPTTLLTGVGTVENVSSDYSLISSKDTYASPGVALTCLGGKSTTPPPGAVVDSSDTYASQDVLLDYKPTGSK